MFVVHNINHSFSVVFSSLNRCYMEDATDNGGGEVVVARCYGRLKGKK